MARSEPAVEPGWGESFRRAPLGVVLLGGLLFFLGAVAVVGGIYLALARGDTGWFAWVSALLLGPVAMYLSMHLVRGTRWAWLSLVILVLLLLASSVVRAVGSPTFPVSPVVELVLEAGCLFYLSRLPVRRAFGRG